MTRYGAGCEGEDQWRAGADCLTPIYTDGTDNGGFEGKDENLTTDLHGSTPI
jgi:hypothetical protein